MSNYHDDTTPAVCDSCLGSNPYIDMKRQLNGAECKICSKPFTVFKWNAEFQDGTKSLKKTVICLTCARSKNRCQSCLLDLTFGIPIEMRDKLFKLAKLKDFNSTNDIVSNATNTTSRLYNSNLLEEKFKSEQINDHLIDNDHLKSTLQSNLQNTINIKDDNKLKNNKEYILSLIKSFPLNGNLLYTPKNIKIKSFFFFGNTSSLLTSQIKDYFNNLLSSKNDIIISIVTKANFGYIEFKTRQIAENIASVIYKKQLKSKNIDKYILPCLIIISNIPIRVAWSIKSNISTINYDDNDLKRIASVIDKQLIKLAKQDSGKHKHLVGSKISKQS